MSAQPISSHAIEHHTDAAGFDELRVMVTRHTHGDQFEMFEVIDRLETLVGQVIDGVVELAVALDDATNGTAARATECGGTPAG